VLALDNQIAKAEQQLNELIKGSSSKNLFVPFARAPDIGMELGRRIRDVRIHQEVYALLVQQLEQAKIMEAKDTPKIQFLERAKPPYKKSWPKRSLLTVFGFIVGLFTSICVALATHWWDEILTKKENMEKIITIKEMLA
jgi:uncharacterized protein involved in exopolysaccharide biosynthesis